jgi:hypothetical protein
MLPPPGDLGLQQEALAQVGAVADVLLHLLEGHLAV